MKLEIITIGQPKLSFAKEGFFEYIKRLKFFHDVVVIHLKDGSSDRKILDSIGNNFCVVLDENGKEFTSKELAEFLNQKVLHGISKMCFVVGGPDGHTDLIKQKADILWSFGKLTLPHDLAMVILSEALYRASTINVNHPYHRG
jgi:23S rRNA (pseudouridine1915-N3)-methyltransferase